MTDTVVCTDKACGHEGPPVAGRERLRAKVAWLCEACRGRVDYTPPPRKRRRRIYGRNSR